MIPVLINNPLFRGITPEKLSANLEEISFHTRSYKKGEILARQGDVCNRLVILTKGSVRGEMIDYSGRLIKVEDIAAPRAIAPLFLFGEENRYPVEVTANEPTEVIEIPKTSVLELFRKNEQFLENYMNLSANYARTLSDKLFFMSFKTIRQKIASYLLRLYKQQQQLHITLDRSQQELSDYFGVSRPSLHANWHTCRKTDYSLPTGNRSLSFKKKSLSGLSNRVCRYPQKNIHCCNISYRTARNLCSTFAFINQED